MRTQRQHRQEHRNDKEPNDDAHYDNQYGLEQSRHRFYGAIHLLIICVGDAFGNGAEIPKPFTCEGGDRSPPLSWSGLPASAKSIALVVDDPDAPDPAAPKTTWVHWVLYDLPPTARGLGEAPKELPAGRARG